MTITYKVENFKQETTAAVRVTCKEIMAVVMETFKLVSENFTGYEGKTPQSILLF
jgi:hypothetical protein